MGLRYKVGGDTLNYMGWYSTARDLSNWVPFHPLERLEPGFTLMGAFVKSLGGEFYHFQLLHALILNISLFYFISKNTPYRFSALLVAFLTYYIYFSTEVLREAIAVMIFILNYNSFIKKKWVKYYMGVIIAIFFHFSASFLLILPVFRWLKFNKSFILITIGFIVFCLTLKPFFQLLSLLAPVIGKKIDNYSDYYFVGYFWAGLRILQFVIIPILIMVACKRIYFIKPKYPIVYLFLIISGIGVIFAPIIFQRFTNYFYPLFALSLTDVICSGIKSTTLNRQFTTFLLSLVIIFSYGTYFIYLNAYQMWLPYSSIINPIDYSFRQNFANGGSG